MNDQLDNVVNIAIAILCLKTMFLALDFSCLA
jgi:hypothetical protein